jgi:aspartyl protease family protein
MSSTLKLAFACCIAALIAASLLPRVLPRAGLAHAPQASNVAVPAPPPMQARPAPPAPSVVPVPVPIAARHVEPAREPEGFGFRRIDLPIGRDGHFHADVDIDGRHVPMLVDTGASYIALSARDADFLGVTPRASDFTLTMATANGLAKAAHVRLHAVHIDTLTLYDVDAIVAQPGAMNGSLLGMSFLRRLTRFEAEPDRLRLTQ